MIMTIRHSLALAHKQNSDNTNYSSNKTEGSGTKSDSKQQQGKAGKFSPVSKPSFRPTCFQPTKDMKGKSKKIEKMNKKSKDTKSSKSSKNNKCSNAIGDVYNDVPPPPPGYSSGGGKGGSNSKRVPTDSPTPAPISKRGGVLMIRIFLPHLLPTDL